MQLGSARRRFPSPTCYVKNNAADRDIDWPDESPGPRRCLGLLRAKRAWKRPSPSSVLKHGNMVWGNTPANGGGRATRQVQGRLVRSQLIFYLCRWTVGRRAMRPGTLPKIGCVSEAARIDGCFSEFLNPNIHVCP